MGEMEFRRKLIDKIEGKTGSLTSINWHEMSTRDMTMLAAEILNDLSIKIEYINSNYDLKPGERR